MTLICNVTEQTLVELLLILDLAIIPYGKEKGGNALALNES